MRVARGHSLTGVVPHQDTISPSLYPVGTNGQLAIQVHFETWLAHDSRAETRALSEFEVLTPYQAAHHESRGVMMGSTQPCVVIHMVASLDGFIARRNGGVDWLETSDEFEDGETLDPEFAQEFLKTIDCYVMGSKTYETALGFEAKGLGWVYGDKPTFVLTSRDLPKTRNTVEFYSGDLARFVNERLKPTFPSIWFVGGGDVSGQCLRLGLADEVRYSIMPILIGKGVPFFDWLDKDVALHLIEVKAYKSGMVALRHEVRR